MYFARGVAGDSGQVRIEKVASSGGTPQLVIELPEGCGLRELTSSRQGDKFVCAVVEVESDVWVVDNFR